jgi:3-oxoacyl-[acyl-carrier protein] reductase
MILKDQVALITGAARGIGKAIAARLACEGASVAIIDIDGEQARKTALELECESLRAVPYTCDVADPGEANKVVKKVVSDLERIDILVNNAGITRDGLLMRMKPEEWDLVLAVNLKGAFNFIRSACRQMMKQRAGAIVNISSVIGLTGNAGQANYSASKAGLLGLTKSAAKEFAPRGIRVNAVAPGFIETEMTAVLPEEAKQGWLASVPLNRAGSMEEVASAVLFLVGPDSEYITGQVLQVDGGMIM